MKSLQVGSCRGKICGHELLIHVGTSDEGNDGLFPFYLSLVSILYTVIFKEIVSAIVMSVECIVSLLIIEPLEFPGSRQDAA